MSIHVQGSGCRVRVMVRIRVRVRVRLWKGLGYWFVEGPYAKLSHILVIEAS